MLLVHFHLVYEEAFDEGVRGHTRLRRVAWLFTIATPSIIRGVLSQQSFLCGVFGALGISVAPISLNLFLLYLRELLLILGTFMLVHRQGSSNVD